MCEPIYIMMNKKKEYPGTGANIKKKKKKSLNLVCPTILMPFKSEGLSIFVDKSVDSTLLDLI